MTALLESLSATYIELPLHILRTVHNSQGDVTRRRLLARIAAVITHRLISSEYGRNINVTGLYYTYEQLGYVHISTM